MKSVKEYINEALKLGSSQSRYKYYPETKKELQNLLKQLIEERGYDGDFNDIDTSEITDMSSLFSGTALGIYRFNGDISGWDVSNVTDMSFMFANCKNFNQDISNWVVSSVTTMVGMFHNSVFDGDISK